MIGRQASRVAVVVAICSGCGDTNRATSPTAPSPTTVTATDLVTRAIPPNNLIAPIDPTAISRGGAPISPFDVVRSGLDQGPVGHPGIDLPSAVGTPVLAVAAGRIVTIRQADPHNLGGQEVRLLIGEVRRQGPAGYSFTRMSRSLPGSATERKSESVSHSRTARCHRQMATISSWPGHSTISGSIKIRSAGCINLTAASGRASKNTSIPFSVPTRASSAGG